MSNISYNLYDSSSNFIDVTPAKGSIETGSKIINLNRTPEGGLFLHTFSSFKNFKFKYSLFPSSMATVVNSWFNSQELCQLEIIDELSTQIFSVQIINKTTPFSEFSNSEMIHFKGKLDLTVY